MRVSSVPARPIHWWEWPLLAFVPRRVNWDMENKLITVSKKMFGRTYIVHQEPVAYGDQRNRQLDRFGG